jgi:hypothetical protein
MYFQGSFARHTIVYPPLALMVWPVMKLAASEARNTKTDATSSDTAIRRNGCTFAILARISSERHRRCPPLHMLSGRKRLGERHHSGLAGRIDALLISTHSPGVRAQADHDPETARNHAIQYAPRAVNHSPEVDLDFLFPLLATLLHEKP